MENMENIINLEAENAELREALIEISAHIDAINEIIDGLSDLLVDPSDDKHVTNEDVKSLLKKYSALST